MTVEHASRASFERIEKQRWAHLRAAPKQTDERPDEDLADCE